MKPLSNYKLTTYAIPANLFTIRNELILQGDEEKFEWVMIKGAVLE